MGAYNIDFSMSDYQDVLPDISEYLKHDQILGGRELEKGNIENCFWRKHIPTDDELKSDNFRETEVRRALRTGVWVANKSEVLWIPPNYYHALQYGMPGGNEMEFRLKRLKHVYFKIKARNNKYCLGTLTIKNRQDGDTTMLISDTHWEMMDGNMQVGGIGIQSMSRELVIDTCWNVNKILWQFYPSWYKDILYPDFKSEGKMEQKMVFSRNADIERGVSARNIVFKYFPCKHNAMDGMSNLIRCDLDEVCKWVECQIEDAIINYSNILMPGRERRGVLDMISSPADVPTKSNEQIAEIWDKSDPLTNDANGVPTSRIMRHYNNPLDGIMGYYDKYGDAEPDEIYKWIMSGRKTVSNDKLMGKIRAFPLNKSEMFGSFDGGKIWRNIKGIEDRKVYLIGKRFKDEHKKEPILVRGNLEWDQGRLDTDVFFRMSDKNQFDEEEARFAFSYIPKDKKELQYGIVDNYQGEVGVRPLPPLASLVEAIIGVDGYQERHKTERGSKGAMVNHKFRDFSSSGIVDCPTMIYLARPQHDATFHEDCIKAAVYNRSLVQPESISSKVIDYFEDRGYLDWMLNPRGKSKGEYRRGDAPTGGKNAYLGEIIGLIDAITNLPMEGEKYKLLLNWFYDLLDDVSRFDRKRTQKNDLTMAWGASLLGVVKVLLHQDRRKKDNLLEDILGLM